MARWIEDYPWWRPVARRLPLVALSIIALWSMRKRRTDDDRQRSLPIMRRLRSRIWL